jgi:hypothetical protein
MVCGEFPCEALARFSNPKEPSARGNYLYRQGQGADLLETRGWADPASGVIVV